MSLVSVIIPVYNAERTIEECILSVLNQSYKQLELIIIDDGSTDNSAAIAKKFQSSNCTVISGPNRGASATRNEGLKRAHGDFIQFLDADDVLSEDKLENQVRLLKKNPQHLAVCSTVHFFDGEDYKTCNPNPYEEAFLISTNDPSDFLIKLWGGYSGKASMVQPNAWLVPKLILEKAGNWDENLSLDDDGEFFCRVILNSAGIIRDKISRSYYRKYSTKASLSSDLSHKALQSLLRSLISKKKNLLEKNSSTQAKIAIANSFQNLCILTYKRDTQIYKEANLELQALEVRPNTSPEIGGQILQLITKLFGWRLAKSLSLIKQKQIYK